MNHPSNLIFLSGSLRSGTSLLVRLLATATGGQAYPQPMPLIMVNLMAEFLATQGASERRRSFPLADEVFGTTINQEDFVRFLKNRRISRDEAERWLSAATGYSGVCSWPDKDGAPLSDWTGGDLTGLGLHYLSTAHNSDATLVWKETICESFAPYFLESGARVVITVRDPRDMLTSQMHGTSDRQIGPPRPILFQIRQWRRSVAYALQAKRSRYGAIARFESLVEDPEQTLDRLLTDIQLNTPLALDGALAGWQPNTSFEPIDGVSSQTVGRHKEYLRSSVRAFIEASCLPEMKARGMTVELSPIDALDALRAGPGPETIHRPSLHHYAYTSSRENEEIKRLESLLDMGKPFDPVMHITPTGHADLQDAMRTQS